MSVTFTTNLPALQGTEAEPCLCAQMAEAFFAFMNGEDTEALRRELAEAANPSCSICNGTGIEDVPMGDPITYNLSNDNAEALLGMLGLQGLVGECTIADARRGLLRARNIRLDPYVVPSEIEYGKPRQREDGVVELQPLRVFSKGLDEEGLLERVSRFENFLSRASVAGASSISWS